MSKISYKVSRLGSVFHDYAEARTLRKYLVALLGQAGLSIFNFCLNILLLRSLSAHDYGSYALSFVFATLASSVNGALCCGPLIVFGTARSGSPSRFAVETLLSTINAGIVLFIMVLSVPVVRTFTGQTLLVCLAAASFISSYAFRTFTRTFAYARLRPPVALAGDLFNIAVASGVLLSEFYLFDRRVALSSALAALAAGNIAAALLETRMLRLGWRITLRRSSLRRYPPIWKQARWSLLGSTTTLMQNQAHSFLVTLVYGPTAYAPLAAGQVIVAPLRILTTAWQSVMQPEIVLAIRQHDRATIRRALKYSALALTCIVVALGATVAWFWDPVFDLLYARKYHEDTMRLIVSLWWAIALVRRHLVRAERRPPSLPQIPRPCSRHGVWSRAQHHRRCRRAFHHGSGVVAAGCADG